MVREAGRMKNSNGEWRVLVRHERAREWRAAYRATEQARDTYSTTPNHRQCDLDDSNGVKGGKGLFCFNDIF
jgi:hypothetical protein